MRQCTATIVALLAYMGYVWLSFPSPDTILDIASTYQHYAIVLALVLLLAPAESFVYEGSVAFLRADVLVATSIIYWALTDVLQGRYSLDIVHPTSVQTTYILLAFFATVVLITSTIRLKVPRIITDAVDSSIHPQVLFSAIVICFLIGMVYFYWSSYWDFGYMIRSLTKSRFASPWARGISGGFGSLVEHLKYFGYLLPPATALYLYTQKKISVKVVVAIFLMLFFSAFEFQGGGRRITGFLAGSFLLTFLIIRRFDLKLIHYIGVGVVGLLVLILLDMQLQFRNQGYEEMFNKYEVASFEEIRVDDNFLRIAQITELIPDQFPHSGLDYLIWTFTRPIPRAFWPGKPLGPGFDVANMVGAEGVSLTSTVVGESYASFGYVMLIITGTIFGMVCGTVNQFLYRPLGMLGIAMYALICLAIIAGVRSLVDMVIFSYAFWGMVVIHRVWLRKKSYSLMSMSPTQSLRS